MEREKKKKKTSKRLNVLHLRAGRIFMENHSFGGEIIRDDGEFFAGALLRPDLKIRYNRDTDNAGPLCRGTFSLNLGLAGSRDGGNCKWQRASGIEMSEVAKAVISPAPS